jgi:hypothetical protein
MIIIFFFILQIKNLTNQVALARNELLKANSNLDAHNQKIRERESANAELLVSIC